MQTLAQHILDFNRTIRVQCALPNGVRALYPYREQTSIQQSTSAFYLRFYNDNLPRQLILGINPGRLGAGATGIPFTDTKRLTEDCGIAFPDFQTHEPSSVFVYEVIAAYGGVEAFYRDFYISSICPIGFVREELGSTVNFNYYDDKTFAQRLQPEVVSWLKEQSDWGIALDRVVVFGTGKNLAYLQSMQSQLPELRHIVALEHPRYIMQYKSKQRLVYIDKYLSALSGQIQI